MGECETSGVWLVVVIFVAQLIGFVVGWCGHRDSPKRLGDVPLPKRNPRSSRPGEFVVLPKGYEIVHRGQVPPKAPPPPPVRRIREGVEIVKEPGSDH